MKRPQPTAASELVSTTSDKLERERAALVENLAILVVREHRRQQRQVPPQPEDVPTHGPES
jgi:hypothetical protein